MFYVVCRKSLKRSMNMIFLPIIFLLVFQSIFLVNRFTLCANEYCEQRNQNVSLRLLFNYRYLIRRTDFDDFLTCRSGHDSEQFSSSSLGLSFRDICKRRSMQLHRIISTIKFQLNYNRLVNRQHSSKYLL